MAAFVPVAPKRLSVVPSTKWEMERETGLEPATFSLEGLSGYAQWHPSWEAEHFVSSYRVVVGRSLMGRRPVPTASCEQVQAKAGGYPPFKEARWHAVREPHAGLGCAA